ncbi:hypothetical protein T01_2898, partial [Trichinella spiralis]
LPDCGNVIKMNTIHTIFAATITIRQPPLQKAHFQVAKPLTLSKVANAQSRTVVGGVFSILCDSIVRMKSRA